MCDMFSGIEFAVAVNISELLPLDMSLINASKKMNLSKYKVTFQRYQNYTMINKAEL